MNTFISFASGTMASLLAVIIIEAYMWMRRRYTWRALRGLLPSASNSCTIACPAIASDSSASGRGLLSYDDATALAYVVAAQNKLGVSVEIISSLVAARDVGPALVSIGGPASNPFTNSLVSDYCPGLRFHPEGLGIMVQCGEYEFRQTETESFAFLVRLTEATTGRGGPSLLVWGIESIATIAASYFFVERIRSLYFVHRDKDFVVAIKIDPRLGYKALPTHPVILTESAFASR